MEREARIKKQLLKPKLSSSSYDTAWVAMVPLPESPQLPCFPECVEWILQNQQSNGSWGLDQMDSSVTKDVISSTLACVLALQRWDVGSDHITRGLHFIGKNISIIMDEQNDAPIGFNITFPYMIGLAIEMGLEFPVRQTDILGILHLREVELKRLAGDKSNGREAYMAYVAEGLGNLLDWDEAIKFQRKNGSLFNSPSATAAALIHNYDDKALNYLKLLVNEVGGAVPTVYPLNVQCQLSMLDTLEKIGISRYFSSEINTILDRTYSLWLQRDEEIMLDVATCAMAFRHLRMNGFDVSSDELSHVAEASTFRNSLQGILNDKKSILELYKASKVGISENELILDNIGEWSYNLLTENLSTAWAQRTSIIEEVESTLKFPFHSRLDRLYHKWSIEHFDSRGSQMLKTEYLPCNVNQDLLALAVEDFTFSQSVYRDELQHLDSWVIENRLDKLQFARQKMAYCYFSAAGAIFPPELRDLRISWAQNCVLATVVDDLFDVRGSKEEIEDLISLVERWEELPKGESYSEQVQIIFSALYTTVNQLGARASAVQNRDVTKHFIEHWKDLLKCEMLEAERRRMQYVPTMKEYLQSAAVTAAIGPTMLAALYFNGQELMGCVVQDQEYHELLRLTSICCRLLNDSQSLERDEGDEEKVNSVLLLHHHSGGYVPKEVARKAIQMSVFPYMRELLRLVLKEGGVLPRAGKELFWSMCNLCFVFYSDTDGYTSQVEMVSGVDAVIYDPLELQS
ncbi:hypothetical protein ACQ4PT_026687 [Festuca glaucescens]